MRKQTFQYSSWRRPSYSSLQGQVGISKVKANKFQFKGPGPRENTVPRMPALLGVAGVKSAHAQHEVRLKVRPGQPDSKLSCELNRLRCVSVCFKQWDDHTLVILEMAPGNNGMEGRPEANNQGKDACWK